MEAIFESPELIETLWNVNTNDNMLLANPVIRINRNIVECKSPFPPYLCFSFFELIETLWNVNKVETNMFANIAAEN